MLELTDKGNIEVILSDCKLVIEEVDSKINIEIQDIEFHYKSENMSNIYNITTVIDGELTGKILSKVGDKVYLDCNCFRLNSVSNSDTIFIGLRTINILINITKDELELFLLVPNERTVIESIVVRRNVV